jgi:hypothetical protein
MDKIEHRTVATNGINMHIASTGTGPVILFLHGFPELWYSWRHQLLSLSSVGYRCIAPDLRGYGDTDAPRSVSENTGLHVVGDLIGLLDSLGIDMVFLVGHDWGGAWLLGIFALLDLTEWRLWSTLASRSCPGIRKEILCSGLEHCLETITISSGFRFFSSLFFFVIGKYCVSNINVHETVITILFILYFVSVLLADFI